MFILTLLEITINKPRIVETHAAHKYAWHLPGYVVMVADYAKYNLIAHGNFKCHKKTHYCVASGGMQYAQGAAREWCHDAT